MPKDDTEVILSHLLHHCSNLNQSNSLVFQTFADAVRSAAAVALHMVSS